MFRRRIRPSSQVPRAAFVLAAAFVGIVPLVEAGKPLPEVPLVVSFGAAPGMMILSDGSDYADREENVRAFLYPSGGFSFTTRADPAAPVPPLPRKVCFGSGSSIPAGSFFPASCEPLDLELMGQRVTFKEVPVTIQTMADGESVVVFARFNWKVGTIEYRLGYGTDMDGNGILDSPEIRMTCTDASDGKCTTWTVAPEPGGDGTAALFVAVPSTNPKNGKVTWANQHVGDYVMPFVQTLTVKP